MKAKKGTSAGILWILIPVLLMLGACSAEKADNPVLSVPVTVGTAIQKTIPVQLRAIGNVQAYSTVSVKSQIGGQLTRVYFTEGKEVKKGDLLFTIDPRPLEANLKQAEANLARDLAQMEQARANLEKDHAQVKQAEANLARDQFQARNAATEAERYKTLIEKGVVSREQYDRIRTNAESLEASVQADRAAVENAKAAVRASMAAIENAGAAARADEAAVEYARIRLGYCNIRSPLDGRTGSLIVQQGNIIKAEDISLVVINQVAPIYVVFSIPEQYLADVRKFMAAGTLKVTALLAQDGDRPEEGVITFVDNAVDSSTGTIRLRGTYLNQMRKLWPGQFVQVVLTLSSQPNAIVVPSQALQTGQAGQYLFVVKPDLTVESRPVVAGRVFDGETVIEKGVDAGEKVVTDGQLRLFPGAKTEIKNGNSDPGSKENGR